MLDRYIIIENQDTGERLVIDKVVSRYKRLGMGFLNNLRINPAFLKHITFTQREESYKPNILNPFFVQLRRFYGHVSYIWTAEVQEKRYETYGERVLHWHCIVAFDQDIVFGREDVFRLQKYWKYGNLDIQPVRKASLGYLMKYISKALDVEVDAKIRRIGSSHIPAYFRQSFKKFLRALSWFVNAGASFDTLNLVQWDYKGAFVCFGTKLGRWRKMIRELRCKKYLFLYPASPWKRVMFNFDLN